MQSWKQSRFKNYKSTVKKSDIKLNNVELL